MKNFAVFELVDRETYENMGEGALSLFNPDALIALDDLRDFFGKGIIVNNWSWGGKFQWRGFRTPGKATELGNQNSQHAKGNAFDCDIQGFTAEQARQKILADHNNLLLSKIMRMEADVSWLHIDLGPVPKGKERIYLFRV